MTADDPDDLLRIVARAAPPQDRRRGGWCRGLGSEAAPPPERYEAWVRSAAGGNHDRFALYLDAVGTSEQELRRGLADVEVSHPPRLPRWAKTFLRLMRSLREAPVAAPPPTADGEASNPIEEPLRPFLASGEADLERAIGESGLAMTPAARRGILEGLAEGLFAAAIHTFDAELAVRASTARLFDHAGAAPAVRLEAGFEGWLHRCERYPVLAYLIGVVYDNWYNASHEFLHRLASDRGTIERRMFAGRPLGRLADFSGRAGDPHNHGRAVNLLRFESGERLVYKPKDLRISAAFLDLVRWFNDAGQEPPLHVRTLLCRDGYAWEEWVEPAPCRDRREVRRFYRRMGAIVRLLQLLGARDFWLDNLIASGENPVFIDLETVLHQAPKLPPSMSPAEGRAFRRLQGSAVPIGAISQCVPLGRGIEAEDLGALTPPRPFRTPFKFAYSETLRDLLAPHVDLGANIGWSKTDYTPVLDGEPAVAARHLDQVLEGYRAMHETLRSRRHELLRAGGPIRALKRLPIRHIERDTWSCLRIANDSVRTPLLVDAGRREAFFLGLLKPALVDRHPDDGRVRIIAREIEALRELDVPFFLALPDEDVVRTADGEPIARHFEGTAWDRLVGRVEGLDAFPLDEEIELIRSCFSCGPHHAETVRSGASPAPSPAPADPDWLAEAVSLADLVLARGIRGATEDLAWLGLTYHPDIDLRAVEVLRPDVLTGTCGLAVLFADLHAETGCERFAAAARGSLFTTLNALNGVHPLLALLEREPDATPLACGGYYGIGSQLFALRRCAESLDAAELRSAFDDYLELLPVDRLRGQATLDLVCGLAGALLAIVPAGGGKLSQRQARVAAGLASHLADRLDGADGPAEAYPAGAETLRDLPSHAAGLALCLDRLLHHDAVLAAGPGRRSVERLLARFAVADGGAPNAAVEPSAWSTGRLLDGFDRSLSRFRACGEEVDHRRALAKARELYRRRSTTGSWFPDSLAVDAHNLSAVIGLGAIAHGFARLARPRLASIRLLE